MTNHYYNNEKEITRDEAHALTDKSGLMVSEKELKFDKKEEVKHGRINRKPNSGKRD